MIPTLVKMAFPASAIGIEGYEKRLEISFEPNILADPYSMGLHTLDKQSWMRYLSQLSAP